MSAHPTAIDGLVVVSWPVHDDERGFFRQTAQLDEISAVIGRPVTVAQLNHSRTVPGALRGFHAEPWDKLVLAVSGTIQAAVADIRPDSATFGQALTFTIGDPPGERISLFVASGLANAYANIGDRDADYVYAVSENWRPVDKCAVAWNDPDLAVAWDVNNPVLSPEDRDNPTLRERFPDHRPQFRPQFRPEQP